MRVLRSMGQAIAHRGPDDEQFYDDGVLSLVYRRLAIVDIAGGRQPLFNEDASSLLVCNGEIYNHTELRDGLKARHTFKTASDSEVLLHGLEEWQEGVLQRARGMFAFAAWDLRRQRLFLARDRLGIKPLYVCHLPHGLLFGSELKALLVHPECPREMDWRDLSGNPIAQALTPTYVKGIDFLPGASYLVAQAGQKAQVHSYWNLGQHLNTAPFGLDAKRYIAAFDELLESAVAEHLQGEAAVGLHLSGGVDSSLVAAVAAPLRPGMPCYTIVERSNYLAGDALAAADVAATLGLDWSPV
ncbi:MAG: asparagine synthetase B, partial [Rhodoferax sp.]|nr:asparagine synthetase B [Rhodoferax sp.]